MPVLVEMLWRVIGPSGKAIVCGIWPLHHVRHMLGHSNVATTSTYLNAHAVGLAESTKRSDAARCNPLATSEGIEHTPVGNAETPEAANALVQ